MQYSVVNKSRLQGNLRIDAEFYSPDFLRLEKTLNDRQTGQFSTYALFVKKGIFDLSPDFYREQGIPLIRTSEIKDPLIDFSSTVFLDDKTQSLNAKTELTPGDIVFTKIGAYIGDVAMLPGKYKRYNFSQNVTGVKLKKNAIKPGFLLAYLLSKYGNGQIKRIIMLSGQGKLELEDVKNIRVVSLGDQIQTLTHKIILEVELLKEKSIGIYQDAEQMLLSELGLLNWKPKHRLFFVKRFSDTQASGRIDAEFFQPMYEDVVKSVKSSKNHASLGDIVSIKKCIEPGSEAYQDNGIPFLRVSNLSKFGFNSDNQQFISEVLYESLKAHQPKKGEILLSKDATPGIAYYLKDAPGKMVPSGGILRVTVKDPDRVYPEYLTLVLNSAIAQKQIERDAGGSIINHWLVDQVKNTLIPILPALVQKKIAEKVDQSFSDREQSKSLLDIAKRGVEMAIEKSEKDAQNWIDAELKKLKVRLD